MSRKRSYYWLLTKDETGKPYLIYGGVSEDEARQKGFEMLSGLDFEIKSFPTRSQSTASQLCKGNKLESTHSLHESARRLGHNKSLKRIKRREARTYL